MPAWSAEETIDRDAARDVWSMRATKSTLAQAKKTCVDVNEIIPHSGRPLSYRLTMTILAGGSNLVDWSANVGWAAAVSELFAGLEGSFSASSLSTTPALIMGGNKEN